MAARADQIVRRLEAVQTRDSGLQPVGPMTWGTHFCQFYQNQSDLLEIVLPYLRAGLDAGEYCLWVTCDPYSPESALAAVRAAYPNADRLIEAGQLEIVASEDWYLKGGLFEPQRVTDAWLAKLRAALAKGFVGMRIHANESWLDRTTWREFCAYEAALDQALSGEPLIVLCTYPLSHATGAEIFDVAHTHQFSIARRHGAWAVMETAAHVGERAAVAEAKLKLEESAEARAAELARVNEKLRRREEHYRFLAENMSVIVSLHDLDANRVFVSPSYRRVVGEITGNTFDGAHPDDLPKVLQAWDEVIAGRRSTVTFRHRHADGSWRWLEAACRLVDYLGRRHVLVVSRDVTERVRLEEQLQHAQKMESLGRLAGGVAHDLNNILTGIFGYSDLAESETSRGGAVDHYVQEIRLIAERARKLTRQLLAFSRRDIRHPAVVDLGELVSGLEPLLRLLLRENVALEIVRASEPLPVFADPGQLEQVLVNLVVNARDAIGDRGGQVRVTTGIKAVLPDDGTVPDFVHPGHYAQLAVRDDGAGMSPEVAALAFEPFFTTKPPGMGTGLGLSTVFGILRQGGGFIWPESQPGEGTTFNLLVPITPRRKQHELASQRPARGGSVAGLHIMVIESEEAVRRLMVETLERGGATVHAYAGARDALALLADPCRQLDVLISELTAAQIRPSALIGIAARSRPNLHIILASGEDSERSTVETLPSSAIMLQKPFGAHALLHAAASGK